MYKFLSKNNKLPVAGIEPTAKSVDALVRQSYKISSHFKEHKAPIKFYTCRIY